MTKGPIKNVGASVRARLLRISQSRAEDFQLVLTRYANERLLYRLAASTHASKFVLKGAALFTIWNGDPHRATRDLDFLGFGDLSQAQLHRIFGDVIMTDVPPDGVMFDVQSLAVAPIREDQQYGGMRVTLTATVDAARVHLQVDIGFGDAITPAPEEVVFPTLLDSPAPKFRAYPKETVVSEKLEAMVQLGMANSRMKDFYDLVVLSNLFPFDGETLVSAIRATFTRRKTPIPNDTPVALTASFTNDAGKQTQWSGFVRKSGVKDASTLPKTASSILKFVGEPLSGAAADRQFKKQWTPGGEWI